MPTYDPNKKNLTPAQRAAQDERAEEDLYTGRFVSTEFAQAPLNDFMLRLMAEEIPMLDSGSRQRVHQILKDYDGPEITSQEQLPAEIIEIMDLY